MAEGVVTRGGGALQDAPPPVAAPAEPPAVENTDSPRGSVAENPQRPTPEEIARHYLRQVGRENHPSAAAAPVSALGQVATDFAATAALAREVIVDLDLERGTDLALLRDILARLRAAGPVLGAGLAKRIEERLR